MESLGRPKVEVMAADARRINPELLINCFNEGLCEANLDQFLAGVDVCIDGLDFFALDIRRKLNARCRELNIPVIIAGPLGMGTGFLIFQPNGMSFEQWFCVDGLPDEQQYVRFLVGLAPSALHRGYLVNPSRVDLRGHRGPSTVAGCELCGAVAAVEAIKLLLRRGRVRAAPYYHQYDAFSGRLVTKKLRKGNASLTQRLKIAIWSRLAANWSEIGETSSTNNEPMSEIEKILDCARWAPSGDNIQPWRFEIVGPDRLIVHLTQIGDVYDYRDGEPTLISGGALLESIRIAASRWGRDCQWRYRRREGHTHYIEVTLLTRPTIAIDPLISFLPSRSVDRRPFRLRRLTMIQKLELAAAIGPNLTIDWHEKLAQRWSLARLGALATKIRLSTPEAFPIHQRVVDWERSYSPTGIPATATGLSRVSLPMVRWALSSWPRMLKLNRFGGLWSAAFQMDYLPGLMSAAFFTIRANNTSASVNAPEAERTIALLHAGEAVQRFWLTATKLGLSVQPSVAPICFALCGNSGTFTTDQTVLSKAARFSAIAEKRMPGICETVLFSGRLGTARRAQPKRRAVRRPLRDLVTCETNKASNQIPVRGPLVNA